MKYSRQATFVKQANIANGPQQVNNNLPPNLRCASASQTKRTYLLTRPVEGLMRDASRLLGDRLSLLSLRAAGKRT
ncbi:MAG: hypothetical protein O9249_00365, partial [Burkholderiaceae bacterium]|nr:hypothetical protein [Burkholderiaceae bacterium]